MSRALEALIRSHERERQAWERERANLLDRLMLLTGKPWTPSPADLVDEPPLPEPDDDRRDAIVDVDQMIEDAFA